MKTWPSIQHITSDSSLTRLGMFQAVYRSVRVTLDDGTVVGPKLKIVATMIDHAEGPLQHIPLAVVEGDYRLR